MNAFTKKRLKYKKVYKRCPFKEIPKGLGPKYFTCIGCTFHSFIKKIFEDLIDKKPNFLKDYKNDYTLIFYGNIKQLKITQFKDLSPLNGDVIFIISFFRRFCNFYRRI